MRPNNRKSITGNLRSGMDELVNRYGEIKPLIVTSVAIVVITWIAAPVTGGVMVALLVGAGIVLDGAPRQQRTGDSPTRFTWTDHNLYKFLPWKTLGAVSIVLVVWLAMGFIWELVAAFAIIAWTVRRFWWPPLYGWLSSIGRRPSGSAPSSPADPREPDGN